MGYPEIHEALKSLLEFHAEDCLDHSSDFYAEGDEKARFFSEAFLYNLVGKEDARSILGRLRIVCQVAGMPELW